MKLRPQHWAAIAGAAALFLVIYFFGNTVPPRKDAPGTSASGHAGNAPMAGAFPGPTIPPASTDSLLQAAYKTASKEDLAKINTLETAIKAQPDSSKMPDLFDSLAATWQRSRQLYAAALACETAARLAHSEKKLNFAGQFYMEVAGIKAEPSVQLWAAYGAVNCFKQALDLQPDNDTTKLLLASAYIEGTGEIMNGVSILKEITARQPDNIPANLMLGKMDIQSGQIEKAIPRFEKILQAEPNNREALYFLAEAYKGRGDKAKAIETFERLKKIVNDPDFSKDIDDYIKTFQ